MAFSPATILTALRKRPAHERRLLAAVIFVTMAFVIIGLWVTSLERTLSSISNPLLASQQPAAAPGASPAPAGAPADRAPQPPAPLAALKDALSGTVALSRQLITEWKRAESIPATTAEEPAAPAEPAGAAPSPSPEADATPPPAQTANRAPATNPAPGEIIAGAQTEVPYSSYAAARLLSSPLDPRMVARKPEPEQSRAAAIIFYNLSELRRTAGDIYDYFTE